MAMMRMMMRMMIMMRMRMRKHEDDGMMRIMRIGMMRMTRMMMTTTTIDACHHDHVDRDDPAYHDDHDEFQHVGSQLPQTHSHGKATVCITSSPRVTLHPESRCSG